MFTVCIQSIQIKTNPNPCFSAALLLQYIENILAISEGVMERLTQGRVYVPGGGGAEGADGHGQAHGQGCHQTAEG